MTALALPPTILFQPPNQIGLGHISRLLAIATAVRAAAPDLRLPFVIEGHSHGLVEALGFPHICLPGGQDLYETQNWRAWRREERHGLVLDLALAVIHALRPALVVFDCFPHTALANAAVELGVPIAMSLRKMREPGQYFERLDPLWPAVRLILIAEREGTFEVPEALRAKTRFIGPIVRLSPSSRAAEPAPAAARPSPGASSILITGGGGGYPGTIDFYNLALDAFARVRARRPDAEALLVTGPLFHEWRALRLASGARVVPFEPDLPALFEQAALVICQAGYNSVAEVLEAGVPAICVPAPRLLDDQFERAQAFQATSPRVSTYAGGDPEALAALMLDKLTSSTMAKGDDARPARTAADGSAGARLAAETLLELLTVTHAKR